MEWHSEDPWVRNRPIVRVYSPTFQKCGCFAALQVRSSPVHWPRKLQRCSQNQDRDRANGSSDEDLSPDKSAEILLPYPDRFEEFGGSAMLETIRCRRDDYCGPPIGNAGVIHRLILARNSPPGHCCRYESNSRSVVVEILHKNLVFIKKKKDNELLTDFFHYWRLKKPLRIVKKINGGKREKKNSQTILPFIANIFKTDWTFFSFHRNWNNRFEKKVTIHVDFF